MAMPLVVMFPGQSSCVPGMFDDIASEAEGAAILEEASDALGEDLAATICARAPHNNREIQLSVFIANHMHMTRLRRVCPAPVASLGMSLGEYNHLVEIGALAFSDAVRLIDARGRCYDAGPKGIMVSLFPVARDAVEATIAGYQGSGTVEISNDNAPSQVVIAGHRAAVEAVAAHMVEDEYAQAVPIERRIPMHTSVFAPVASEFAPALKAAPWRVPVRDYLPNTTATWAPAPDPAVFMARLSDHVQKAVLWRQSIEAVLQRYPDAVFVEAGPRQVLCNLLGRRWVRNKRYASDVTPLQEIHDALTESGVGIA